MLPASAAGTIIGDLSATALRHVTERAGVDLLVTADPANGRIPSSIGLDAGAAKYGTTLPQVAELYGAGVDDIAALLRRKA